MTSLVSVVNDIIARRDILALMELMDDLTDSVDLLYSDENAEEVPVTLPISGDYTQHTLLWANANELEACRQVMKDWASRV